VTRVTRELLNFWFNNKERQNYQKLFFCQREAVETAVYLNEAAERDPNLGRDFLRQLNERRETVSDAWDDQLPRTAFKMATGTGKTVVMAMLILYHYLNKREYPQDTRFADHFLLVAPGITIRDRLGVLLIDESTRNRNEKKDYYHQRGLIPPHYETVLGGLNSAITITNFHQFEPKVYSGKKASPMDGKLVFKNGEMQKQNDKEDYSSVLSRLLPGKKSKRFIVINDEAHHCYLPKVKEKTKGTTDEATAEGEEENKRAMVWYEGLRQMKALGYKLMQVYDLSATPYYLKGSGYPEYSLFPWVVTDFGLVEAIESGLVKIPFLPSMDDSHQLTEPVLRNIYEKISKELPKKGQRSAKKAAKEAAEKEGKENVLVAEMAPNLPSLLTNALEQFVDDYEKYDRGMREAGEEMMGIFSTPPVFIVVCNNTMVSKEVFKYIAGYQTTDEEGNAVYVDGHFAMFSNSKDGIPKTKMPSLLIDSAAIEDAGATVDDEFKRVFQAEIDEFKREYARNHGAGSAENLSEGDILREVVNTVGKHNSLGSHIRCVVSVSMLTEGWDANTVTHVCGVRAFGSQLLCEQVAGRALRRRSYELTAYDRRTGEEVAPRDRRRYKEENLIYKYQPEYAHIIGVPFKTFKGGQSAPPKPSKPTTVIKPLKEREGLEIKFPNIEGYRDEMLDNRISAKFEGLPTYKLDFTQVPQKTWLQSPVGERTEILSSDYMSLRDAQVVYELTRRLMSQKYRDESGKLLFQKFGQLKAIVQEWYDTMIEFVGGTGRPEQRRLVIFFNEKEVNASIYAGIKEDNRNEERIVGLPNYYNPEGSTRYVFGTTTKNVWPTQKSHINFVVADTDSWEQIAAKTLEELACVKAYVKNSFLDFKIPYCVSNQEHQYIPDFIAVVETPSGEWVHLIIEISGFSNDMTNFKAEKRFYTQNYWLPAANNLKTYGRWAFVEITDINNIKPLIIQKIQSL
jgi:type III restriction enzyme